MSSQAQQYSPPELIEFARVAMDNGNTDDARNVLNYLVQTYPLSNERVIADQMLFQLQPPTPGAVAQQASGEVLSAETDAARSQDETAVRRSRKAFRRPSVDYQTSLKVAQFTSAIGWVFVVVGGLLFLGALGGGGAVAGRQGLGLGLALGFLSSAGLAGFGLFLVLEGQKARAVFDTANMTRELLALEHHKMTSADRD